MASADDGARHVGGAGAEAVAGARHAASGPAASRMRAAAPGLGADARVGAALRNAAARTAKLLRSVPDGGAAVPGLDWTVAQTAAHLAGELGYYTRVVTGEPDVLDELGPAAEGQTPGQRSAAANARQLQELTERDPSRLADMLVPAGDDFIAAAGARPEDESFLVSNGLSMTVPMMLAALLGEQLIHGFDIARAAGASWTIPREDAHLVIAGIMAMVPDYVDREAAAGRHMSYELRFRGGPGYRLSVDDGTAEVTEPGQQADCRISADPVAFLLVGYGRTGQWGQILRGKIMAGGRKPWLGLSFGRLLTSV